MNSKNIVVGQFYRHRSTPKYGWAKVVKVLRPKEAENITTKILVKCEWSVDKTSFISIHKYFRIIDLINE